MSQITTHILDTSLGKPAAGITIRLLLQEGQHWKEMARGITNADGRITDLLPATTIITPGIYKLRFETQPYFEIHSVTTFYPFVEVAFYINGSEHYHVPLLLNPFGYSTYRGS